MESPVAGGPPGGAGVVAGPGGASGPGGSSGTSRKDVSSSSAGVSAGKDMEMPPNRQSGGPPVPGKSGRRERDEREKEREMYGSYVYQQNVRALNSNLGNFIFLSKNKIKLA
jgi:hypothetical protein